MASMAPNPVAGQALSGATAASPMMQQYLALRAQAQADAGDCLLFYRMGDFFELFFEDAVRAAEALDITLTQRGQHQGQDIPMCGVPVHAAESYLARLIRKGFKVAIAEQVEDPAEARKRGSKAVVRREIVRLVTAGTLSEDTLLDAREANILAAITQVGDRLALAWTDMSTGAISVVSTDSSTLDAELARLAPAEVLIPEALASWPMPGAGSAVRTSVDRSLCEFSRAEDRLKRHYGVATLDGFGPFDRAQTSALGMLVGYVGLTQKQAIVRLMRPQAVDAGAMLLIDAATRASLDLVAGPGGDRSHSLLGVIDRTLTGGGARLLRARLTAPLIALAAIAHRQDWIELLLGDVVLRARLRQILKPTPDLERALGRLALGRASPRDLAMIRTGLVSAAALAERLDGARATALAWPEAVAATRSGFGRHGALVDLLERALVAEPPLALADGGVIAPGHDAALDELRSLAGEGRRHLAALEGRYRDETGIGVLKIRHNAVIGFHIEVPARHGDALMAAGAASPFIHRQTMANAMRFTTAELAALAQRIDQAGAQAQAREAALFDDLRQHVLADAEAIAQTAEAIAQVDVAAALADLAESQNWCRPLVDESCAFAITAGRHPVVEAALARQHQAFIANDCGLDPQQRLWLVTGPNMAGKSTFLRQNALIVVLAQMGSYVPATSAHIGSVDRLFSRVGAADDLARGQSTFMVEMVETAAILHRASPRSLVILDEVGRGTATYDGLSIAWATLEHLHDVNCCRCLFATHYHELTRLAARLPALALHTVTVKLWQDQLMFLHAIAPGAADRSYGLQVAKLAGLPASVLARAGEVLQQLEVMSQAGGPGRALDALHALPLFQSQQASVPIAKPHPALVALAETDADTLTPRAALDLIYALKALATGNSAP
jgi:DNA mismatch repair protein MutS